MADDKDETDKGGKPDYPPGYEHVADIAQSARQRVAALDAALDGGTKANLPDLSFTPPKDVGSDKAGASATNATIYTRQRQEILDQARKDIEQATSQGHPITDKAVRDHANDHIDAKAQAQREAAEKQAANDKNDKGKDSWDMDKAQDGMAQKIEESKANPTSQAQQQERDSEKPQSPATEQKPPMSMSQRFNQSLTYTQVQQRPEPPAPQPAKEPEPER